MKPFPSNLDRRTLDNGLRFVARSLPQMPVTSTMIWYRAGSADEVTGKTGVAHFLEHMLFKGTGNLRQGQIDRITQRYGGTNNAFTWLDSTAYFFNFSQDRWRVALQIEAERMRGCLLSSREFEREKSVILEERSIEMDVPEGVLLEEVNRAAFSVHPYGQPIIGWLEDLEALEPQDLWSFYETWYVPNNAAIVMVGNFDVEQAYEQVRRSFGSLVPAPELPRRRLVEPPQRGERRVLVERRCEAPHLLLAYHAPQADHPDTAPLALLDLLLTEGRTSRLHERLVDREKLATSVDSALYETAQPYLFTIHVDLHPGGSLERVEALLGEELERLAERGPTREELRRAKRLFEADWVLDHQTAEEQATRIGEALTWGSLETLERLPRAIEAVERRDVQRVAATYFQRTNRTVGHLLPCKADPPLLSLRPLAAAAVRPRRARPKLERPAVRTGWKTGRLDRAVPRLHVEGERMRLDNGLTLLALPNPAVPSVVLELLVPTGLRNEPAALAGRAPLLARMLLEGTATRSARQIALTTEALGAKLDTAAGYQYTQISAEALPADLDIVLQIVADLVRNATFPEVELEDRRREQLSSIAQLEDDARRVAVLRFNEIVYRGHPVQRPLLGRASTVAALGREELVEEYRAAFVPGACVLAVAGDFGAPERLRLLVEQHLGAWPARPLPERPAPPVLRLQRAQRVKVVRKAKEQVHLIAGHLGIRRTDPDFEAGVVLDLILGQGSGFTDRLSQRLRDREGLAYTVSASITRNAGREPGTFSAYIGTSPQHVGRALRGIREEVGRIRDEPPSRSEVERIRSYAVGQYPFGLQTNHDLVGYALMCEEYGWPLDYHRHFLAALTRVSAEDVQRFARRHLHPDRFTVVAVGPVRAADLRL